MAKSNTLAWVVGLGTVAVAGVGIYLYEKSQTTGTTAAAATTTPTGVNSPAQAFLVANNTSPSPAAALVAKALTLAALNHTDVGATDVTNAIAQGANSVEKQALQMAGYTVS